MKYLQINPNNIGEDLVQDRLPRVRYIVLLIIVQFHNFPNYIWTPGDRIILQLIIHCFTVYCQQQTQIFPYFDCQCPCGIKAVLVVLTHLMTTL